MNIKTALLWAIMMLSMNIGTAFAEVMFYGYNVYSPHVMHDDIEPAQSAYKMWYGGQEVAGSQDAIFLRTSSDSASWSSYRRVLTTADIPLDCPSGCGYAGAVNDPSVTRHFNASMQAYEWTMFYTVAMCDDDITPNGCNEQIWSSVSYDGGRTWKYHKLVTRGSQINQRYTTTPSAIWMGDYWLVYFAEAGPAADMNVVHEMKVRWDRTVESYRVVYIAPTGFWTSNPEVKFFSDKAYLFFNSGSLYKLETTTLPPQWGSAQPQAIVPVTAPPSDGTICAAITPGVAATGSGYDVYFSTPLWNNNDCDVWHNVAIHRWRFEG
jgi:hypothetical protein